MEHWDSRRQGTADNSSYLIYKRNFAIFSDHDDAVWVVFAEQAEHVTTNTNVGGKKSFFGRFLLGLQRAQAS